MSTTRVIMFGFQNMNEYIFTPMVKEITETSSIEVVHTIDEFDQLGSEVLVDIIVISIMAVGFNVNLQLQHIKIRFPEAFIICISPHPMSNFFSLKLVKNGIDALVMNITCDTEYQRMRAAIRNRRKYYPAALRDYMDAGNIYCNQGYRFLSKNEYNALVYTLKGLTLKEIAKELDIAETTACTTRQNSFRKMGVTNLVDLVKIGFQFNLHQEDK